MKCKKIWFGLFLIFLSAECFRIKNYYFILKNSIVIINFIIILLFAILVAISIIFANSNLFVVVVVYPLRISVSVPHILKKCVCGCCFQF